MLSMFDQLDEIAHMFGVAKIKSTLVPTVCRVVRGGQARGVNEMESGLVSVQHSQ